MVFRVLGNSAERSPAISVNCFMTKDCPADCEPIAAQVLDSQRLVLLGAVKSLRCGIELCFKPTANLDLLAGHRKASE